MFRTTKALIASTDVDGFRVDTPMQVSAPPFLLAFLLLTYYLFTIFAICLLFIY